MLRRNLTITQLADWLERNIQKAITDIPSNRFVIVAHSMGGLIAREIILLRTLAGVTKPAMLIEIGTPHTGANPAKLASTLGISKNLTAAMKADSSYLKDLRVRWNRTSNRPPTACFSSPHDKVVSQSSAHAQCDDIQSYPQWGHSEMVKPENNLDDRYVRPSDELADILESFAIR
jgi:surfactin synthase thioesterase subunit